jgi:eukaryotic-like serine/threonine-protein kinase
VDGRADLYALGCVAYYLLTASLVFTAENALQVIARHLQHEPVLPSERIGVPLPAELERVVMACLAKRPQGRPQSAKQLAARLAAIDVEPWGESQAEAWWGESLQHPIA